MLQESVGCNSWYCVGRCVCNGVLPFALSSYPTEDGLVALGGYTEEYESVGHDGCIGRHGWPHLVHLYCSIPPHT